MFNDSEESLSQSVGEMRSIDYALTQRDYIPSVPEAAKASFTTALDRVIVGRWLEEFQIGRAELKAEEAGPIAQYRNQEEYEADEYYIPNVKYTEARNRTRAKILKDNYTWRRSNEDVLRGADENGNSWIYTPVSFAAGMVGSLPDPVNVLAMAVPGAQAVKFGAKLGMGVKQAAKTAFNAKAMAVGAGTNFISSAYAQQDLNVKGEHITAVDVLMDTMMGAALVPIFATGGAMLSRTTARSKTRSYLTALQEKFPDATEIADIRASLKTSTSEAWRNAGDTIEKWSKAADGNRDVMDFVRARVMPEDRLEMSRWTEYAMGKFANGEDVDMGTIMSTPQARSTLKRLEDVINEYKIEKHETPIVLENMEAARGELKTFETDMGKLSAAYAQAVHFAQPERTGLGESLSRVENVIKTIREPLAELDALTQAKTATLRDIKNAKEALTAAKNEIQNFNSKMRIPESARTGLDTIAKLEKAITDAETKLADIEAKVEAQVKAEVGTMVSADALDHSPIRGRTAEVVAPVQHLSMEGMSRAQEYQTSGIDMSTPERPGSMKSDAERMTGEARADEAAILKEMADLEAHTMEDASINKRQKFMLEDTDLVNCLTEGFLV